MRSHLLQSVLWFCSLHRLVLFKAVDFIWVWQLQSGAPSSLACSLPQVSLGAGGVSEVGLGTKKADLAGSCSCQHLPEPAGKVIFGAQSPGVIGAFLCERAAQSLPGPSGAIAPPSASLLDDSIRIAGFL